MPTTRHFALRTVEVLFKHSLLIAALVIMLYPLGWLFTSSLLPTDKIFGGGLLAWSDLSLDNYLNGWNQLTYPFGRYLLNSVLLATLAIIGNVLACSAAAYCFARLEFPFRRVLFALMLGMLMVPIHVTLVPQYVLFSKLGWVDTYLPLIIPKFLAVDSFFVFLMYQFIRGLPRELDQAAYVDGAGPVRTFVHLVVPLLKPAIATTATFTFIWTWNDFLAQLIYISSPDLTTVPLALRQFMDSTGGSSWGELLAMSGLSLVPLLVFFIFMQRYLVEGIATSGLK
ncbi:carbohydrate ABC transporter permease [Propionibacteriaceae bacterium G1746]